jgi:hypothetical protein
MKKWMWAALALLVPAGAAGQIAWDSPMLLPPNPPDGFGLYLVDVAGGDLGVLGTWRSPGRSLGLRAGLADGPGDDLGVYGGFDVVGDLTRATDEFPLDVDWVFGAGIGIVNRALISIPLGLSLGHAFEDEGIGFLPYISPRVVLDACIDCGPGRWRHDDVSLDFAVDLGLDLRTSRSFLIRFGATVGDHRNAVAIGLGF